MKVKLIVNYGYYVLETIHSVGPDLDILVRSMVKSFGRKRIQIVRLTHE